MLRFSTSLVSPSTTSWWYLVVALSAVPLTLVQVLPSALAPKRIRLKPAMSFTSTLLSVSVLAAVSVARSMRSMSLMRLALSLFMALALRTAVRSRLAPPVKRMLS